MIRQSVGVWREVWAFERWRLLGTSALVEVIGPLLGIFLLLCAVAVFFNLVQIGWNPSLYPITPRLKNISPVSGVKRLFSLNGLANLIKGILKLAILGLVSYEVISHALDILGTLGMMDVRHAAGITFRLSMKLLGLSALAFVFIAAADYGFQKYQYERKLMMTRQEVKEEIREHEGDPLVKARIRRVQMEYARRRMLAEVPKAEVVVTNPTEIAVALKYRPKRDTAPVVVAKGKGWLAKRIREIAIRHGVPIVERPELARALYRWVRVGQAIPVKLYQAVAEVLAYIYKLRGMARF
ncbi:MAG TPA: EscU/YscU/HrcU family type III secretion system export apparatus switch protein [Proteobacteria bacterium]|nr:EscU/YscU/HrcU family type III secretion system export apparatus switch protein [Pseudomonadota bacterium]